MAWTGTPQGAVSGPQTNLSLPLSLFGLAQPAKDPLEINVLVIEFLPGFGNARHVICPLGHESRLTRWKVLVCVICLVA